jgi:hypothetical protein
MRGNIALPPFYRQALLALRELTLTQTSLSLDGALSQPIWDNPHYDPPRISQLFRDRWESFQLTVVHNAFSDRRGQTEFTKKDNNLYIDTELDYHYFQEMKITNESFLNSWYDVLARLHAHIMSFPPSNQRKETAKGPGEPNEVRITTDGEYVLYEDGIPFQGISDSLGELAMGEALEDEDLDLDPSPPAKWGKGYKGPRREAFPLPDEYSLDADGTPLDATSVKTLTSLLSNQLKHKPHPCLAAWEKRLGTTEAQWHIIASRYNNDLLTPRDYHLHLKHITHRCIATNNRFADQPSSFADQPSLCRFCHQYGETSVHLGRCPSLTVIFGTINRLVGFAPSGNRSIQQQARDNLFGHPHKDTPACIAHLYMIAWRYILTDFYQLHYDETLPPFDSVRAYTIYTRTLERYTLLVMAKAHRTRALLLSRLRSDILPSNRMVRRTNNKISHLFDLDEEARLLMSAQMAKRLKIARLEHAGKNIPRSSNTQEEQNKTSEPPRSVWEPPRPTRNVGQPN